MAVAQEGSSSDAGQGWARLFGLHPSAAALTVIIDLMVTSTTIASMGLLAPLEIVAGIAVSIIVYRIQRHWYKDDGTSAGIKAMIVGLLTAIPVATTPYIIAYAIAGSFLGRKKPQEIAEVNSSAISDTNNNTFDRS